MMELRQRPSILGSRLRSNRSHRPAWRVPLEERGLGSSSIILRMSALRPPLGRARDAKDRQDGGGAGGGRERSAPLGGGRWRSGAGGRRRAAAAGRPAAN